MLDSWKKSNREWTDDSSHRINFIPFVSIVYVMRLLLTGTITLFEVMWELPGSCSTPKDRFKMASDLQNETHFFFFLARCFWLPKSKHSYQQNQVLGILRKMLRICTKDESSFFLSLALNFADFLYKMLWILCCRLFSNCDLVETQLVGSEGKNSGQEEREDLSRESRGSQGEIIKTMREA